MSVKKPTVLMILDGWGLSEEIDDNAIRLAKTPNMDRLSQEYPYTTLDAHGLAVGLPAGQMGNSEVGHLNIGAGRIVYQDLTRISKAIAEGSFYENPRLLAAMDKAKQENTALHLMGLVSDGGVHSHIEHLFALLEMAQRHGLTKVYIHAFLDGRDVLPQSGIKYIKQLQDKIQELGCGEIASVMGRYYAMDRDNRWERVEKAYKAIVLADAPYKASAVAGIEESCTKGVTDEFVEPFCLPTKETVKMSAQDSVIFFNFRPDRARQITKAIKLADFTGFTRIGELPALFVCMTEYDETFHLPIAFLPEHIKETLGEVVSKHNLRQLRIAETEKYAHVTFFFNGGEEVPYANEDRVLIPSPKVATYDLQPEMSAISVTDKLVSLLQEDTYDLVVINYANTDMVGHTGSIEAAIIAAQTVDGCLGKVVDLVLAKGGSVCITADHGNAEHMRDYTEHEPFTAHTTNRVPFVLVSEQLKNTHLRSDGILADIAPTVLDIMKIDKPKQMTGNSLLAK